MAALLLPLLLLALCPFARAAPDAAPDAAPTARATPSLEQLLENIRRIIREGDEGMGIPPLDPFQLSSLPLELSKERNYQVEGELRNFVARGLSDFQLEIVPDDDDDDDDDFRRRIGVPVSLNVNVSLPAIQLSGNYSADAVLGEVVHLYGDGDFRLNIKEVGATFYLVINVGYTSSSLQELSSVIHMDDFELQVTGLLEGGPLDTIFNLAVNQVAKVIFNDRKATLENLLTAVVSAPLDKALEPYGLKQIMCIIYNTCDDE